MSEESTTTTESTTTDQTTTQTQTGADGGGDHTPSEFLTSLGEQYSGNEAFSGIDSPQALADKFVELQGSRAELQSQIDGMPKAPETPDGYTVPAAPEGINLDEGAINTFRTEMHKLGVTDEQFQAGLNVQFSMLQAQRDKINTENSEMMETIKKELGSKFDATLGEVNQLMDKIPELKPLMGEVDVNGETSLMRTNPKVFSALAKIASLISADHIPGGGGPGGGSERQTTESGKPRLSYPSMKT